VKLEKSKGKEEGSLTLIRMYNWTDNQLWELLSVRVPTIMVIHIQVRGRDLFVYEKQFRYCGENQIMLCPTFYLGATPHLNRTEYFQ